jgi:hypothetical protein
LWRCGDGLFFEVPPLAIDALLTMLHPLLKSMPHTIDHFEISCLRALYFLPLSLLSYSNVSNSRGFVVEGPALAVCVTKKFF